MSAKVLFSAKTHTTAGPTGAGRSSDGFVDVKLPQPHPAAENLFGVLGGAEFCLDVGRIAGLGAAKQH